MRNIVLAFLLVFSALTASYSQNETFRAPVAKTIKSQILESQFYDYDIVSLDVAALNQYIKNHRNDISVGLQWSAGATTQWNLTPRDLRSENYQSVFITEEGSVPQPRTENTTYTGVANGIEGDYVSLSIDNDAVYAMWQENGQVYYLEPLWRLDSLQNHEYYLLYAKDQVKPMPAGFCGWSEDLHDLYNRPMARIQSEMNFTNSEKVGNCYITEVALAADWAIVQAFGGSSGALTFMTGVLNNVQTNYDNEFADQIDFEIVGTFLPTCSTCNPWTSSADAGNLLDDFAVWAEGGGFGATIYDVACLWTNRDLIGTTIGVAWLGGLCTDSRYCVLQNFSSNTEFLRVLQAHEIGHLFNADHDDSSSPTIMAPTVSNTTQWSSLSISVINAYISSNASPNGCLSGCQAQAPPVAAIFAPVTHICPGSTIPIIDNSTGGPTEWDWFFPGGSPSSSTQQHPSVTYDNIGSYPVTLIVSNNAGVDATALSQNIEVDNDGTKYLLYETFESGPAFWEIYNPNSGSITWQWVSVGGTQYGKRAMSINNYNYTSLNHVDGLVSPPLDLSNESGVTLQIDYAYRRFNAANSDRMRIVVSTNGGQTYPFTIFDQTENGSGNLATAADSQQPFTPTAINDWCYGTDFGADCISIPLDNFEGLSNVRFRIDNITDHGNNLYIDNIRVTADCQTILPPVAAFTGAPTIGCAPLNVQYQDQSTGIIFSRQWNFPGGNPALSSEINPMVTYSQPGTYSATLQVTNPSGTDLAVQGDYILVLGPPTVNFQSNVQGNVATFTNQTTNAEGYLWNFGDGGTSTQANPAHTYSQAGTYTVRLTATNDCGSRFIIQTITVTNPLVAAFSANQQSGCAPLVVQFEDESTGGANSWAWTFGGGQPGTSTLANPVVTFATPGTYIVSLTVGNGFGQQTISDTIIVEGPPAAGFSADTTLGQTLVAFSSGSIGADSLFWDFGDGATDSTSTAPTHSYDSSGIYTVVLIAVNACGSDTSQQNVGILTPPLAIFSSSNAIGCAPLEIAFSADTQGDGLSYYWIFEGGQPDTSTAANPLISYAATGTYPVTLVVSNAAGSDTAQQTAYVTVLSEPLSSFSYDYSVGQLDATFTNNTLADSVYWDFGDGVTSMENSPVHHYATDGNYVVSLIVFASCGSDTSQQTISIITPPQAALSSSTSSGCAPLQVSYSAQPSGAAYTYSWIFEGGTPASSVLPNPVVTYSQAGTYPVTLIVSNIAGADTIVQDAYVTTSGPPSAGFGYINIPGSGQVIFDNTSSGATHWQWLFGDGQSSVDQSPVYTYTAEGQYIVTLIAYNECGSDTTQQTISIILPPQAGFTSNGSSGCAPLEVTFAASPQGPGISYVWSFEGGQPATSTDANPVVSYQQAGTYSVTLMVSNVAGIDMITQNNFVVISDAPTASFTSVVNGPSVSFFNSTSGADSYSWDFGDGQISSDTSPGHTYATEGEYVVTLTAANACGSVIYSDTVAIDEDLPQSNFSAGVQSGCGPLTVQFASQAINADSLHWSFPGGTPAGSSEVFPVVTYSSPGLYSVTLTAFNVAGSASLTRTNWIEVLPNVIADFNFNVNETTVNFNNNSGGANSYTWHFGDGQSSDESNPVHTYPGAGAYEVLLVAEGPCGVDTTSMIVDITGTAPIPEFTASVQTGCAPMVVQFEDTSTGEVSDRQWEFPGGDPAISSEPNPVVSYNNPGIYDVNLTVLNAFGSNAIHKSEYLIINSIPQAAFTYQTSILEVTFEAVPSVANTSWRWDFGDGATAQTQTAQHTYNEPGSYEVMLIAENECGSDTAIQLIQLIVDAVEEADRTIGTLFLYPNPTNGHFTLSLSVAEATTARLQFSNAIGQTMLSKQLYLSQGVVNQHYDFLNWPAGVYWCAIYFEDRILRTSFVIQH